MVVCMVCADVIIYVIMEHSITMYENANYILCLIIKCYIIVPG